MSDGQLFHVNLLVRNDHGNYDGWCDAITVSHYYFGDLAMFECMDHIARFEARPMCFQLDGYSFDWISYQVHVGNICWDMAYMTRKSVSDLWRILAWKYWKILDLVEADPFLFDRWEQRRPVDFVVFDYQSAFYDAMYKICGKVG